MGKSGLPALTLHPLAAVVNGLGFAQEGFLPAREPEATSTTTI